jgi:peptide/nickel transport system substrate-binding protein
MGRKEKIAVLTLALAGFFSLAISVHGFYIKHTQIAPAQEGQLTEGLLGQPQYINPLLAISEADQSLNRLIFSGLYKYGPNGELIPDLAEGMPVISEDQKSYTVKIKQNAKWHNQTDLTADDVVFTLETLKNPEFKSPLRALWLNTSVEKLSDHEVRFVNKDISGPFIYNLTLPILPKNVWGEVDPSSFLLHRSNMEAIGSGPYAISQINKLPSGKVQSIALRSFSKFHGAPANIENFIVKFYDSSEDLLNGLRGKEIDLAALTPQPSDDLAGLEKNFQSLNLSLPQYQIAYFNLSDGLTSQEFIRKALSQATDQSAIIDKAFSGQRQLPVDPLIAGQSAAGETNLISAMQTLDAAGWLVGPDGKRQKGGQTLGITITTSDSAINTLVGEILQKQWQQLGIDVNLDIKPSRLLTDEVIRGRKFQALIFSQKFGTDPDPFFFWHSSQAKDPGLNLTGLSDGNLDKLLTEARNTTQTALRLEKYAQIGRAIGEKYPEILLNQSKLVYFVRSDIKNIQLQTLRDPFARFYDVPNWYVETKRVWK